MTYRCGMLRFVNLLSRNKLSLCRLLQKNYLPQRVLILSTWRQQIFSKSSVCMKCVDKSVLKYGNEKNYKKIKANIVFRLIVFVGNVSASVIHSRKVHLVAKCTKQMSWQSFHAPSSLSLYWHSTFREPVKHTSSAKGYLPFCRPNFRREACCG